MAQKCSQLVEKRCVGALRGSYLQPLPGRFLCLPCPHADVGAITKCVLPLDCDSTLFQTFSATQGLEEMEGPRQVGEEGVSGKHRSPMDNKSQVRHWVL